MADLDLFRSYVTAVQTASSYKTWAAANPGELNRWIVYRDAVLAGAAATPPTMTTYFGQSLVLAARMGANG